MTTQEKRPGEWDESDYQESVETHADVAEVRMAEGDGAIHAVESAISGAREFTHHAERNATIRLSDADPDSPEYTTGFETAGVETWREVKELAAYTMLFEDVMAELDSRGKL